MVGHGGTTTIQLFRKTATAVFFALCVGGQSLAQEAQRMVVTPEQSRAIAQQALARGDLALARDISAALLQRDETDPIAWIVRGVVAQRTGNPAVALDAAGRAYRLSDNRALRYDAAWLAANSAGALERWEVAKLWLRRADQAADSDAAQEQVAGAFRVARERSPWSTRLSFSVSPSDNVNGGTDPGNSVDAGLVFELGGEPAAKGVEVELSLSTQYRLSENETQRTELLGEFYGRKVYLADGELERINARRPLDPARSTEYDYAQIAVGIRHERLAFPDLGPTAMTARIGASYYRDEALSNFANVSVDQDIRLSERQALRLGTRLAYTDRKDSKVQSSTAMTVSADLLGRRESGDSYVFGVSYTDHNSDAGTVEGYEVRGRATYALGQTVGGAAVDFGLRVGYRDFPEFVGAAGGRQNWTYSATVGATFDGVSAYGFVPRLEVGYDITDSNVAIYDSEGVSLGVSIVSRF